VQSTMPWVPQVARPPGLVCAMGSIATGYARCKPARAAPRSRPLAIHGGQHRNFSARPIHPEPGDRPVEVVALVCRKTV
jgi:hypothetical protein